MELRHYLRLLQRRWAVLAVTMVVGIAVSFSATDRTSRYESSTLLLVSPERFNLQTEGANVSFDRIAVIDRLLVTYSRMVQSNHVATGAAELLDIDRAPASLIGAVKAEVVTGTQLLRITATDPNPATARDIADATAQSFIAAVEETEDPAVDDSGIIPGGVPVSVFEPARLPVKPLSTGLLGNMILGAVFGLLVAAGACIAVDALDVTVRSVHDAERRLGVPVLGTIPALPSPEKLIARRRAELRRPGLHGTGNGIGTGSNGVHHDAPPAPEVRSRA